MPESASRYRSRLASFNPRSSSGTIVCELGRDFADLVSRSSPGRNGTDEPGTFIPDVCLHGSFKPPRMELDRDLVVLVFELSRD